MSDEEVSPDSRQFRDRCEFRMGRRELALEIFKLRADKSRLVLLVVKLRERLELVRLMASQPTSTPHSIEPTNPQTPATPAETFL